MIYNKSNDNLYENDADSETEMQKNNINTKIVVVLAIFFVFILAIILSVNQSASIYIALGDSVSSGYGVLSETRYTSLLFEKIKKDGYVDEYYNMAQNGFTTSDLLNMLNNLDKKELRKFRKAKLITVNIGGNNLLMPFIEYMSDTRAGRGVENVRAGGSDIGEGTKKLLYEVSTSVRSVVSDSLDASFNAKGAWEGLKQIGSGLWTGIRGTTNVIGGASDAVSVWQGSLPPELESILEQNIENFHIEFREIIFWIEKNAPNATIVINTIFNPIPQDFLRTNIPMSEWVDILILTMNLLILQESEMSGFLVADIYPHISGQTHLSRFNLNPLSGRLTLDMVHPNIAGHRIIADINYDALKQNLR